MAKAETTIAVSRDTQTRLRKLAGMLAIKSGNQVTLDDALRFALDTVEKITQTEVEGSRQ